VIVSLISANPTSSDQVLEQFVISQVFAFLLIFFRLGAAVMVLPGVGEAYVPPRVRLGFALGFSLALTPVLQSSLPSIPGSPLSLMLLILNEVMIGVFMGLIVRIMFAAMHITGMILAMVSGLSSALMFDTTQSSQGSIIGNFLSIVALVLFFSMDLHHIVFKGLLDSYTLFIPGQFLPVDDFANMASRLVSKIFLIAVQLSTPLLMVGLIVYLASGILSRLMPIMPVFFVIIAPQLLISFFLLMITLSAMMLWYMTTLQETLNGFIAP
jgi:flagellar biosynthetic protein FliR